MHPHHHLRRVGTAAVHSVDRIVFTVPDLSEAERFYTTFGLDVRRMADRIDLHCFGHPHRWVSIHSGSTEGSKRLEYVAYGIDEHDVSAFRDRIEQLGLGCEPHPLAERDGLWLKDPDGSVLQLVVAQKVSPSAKSAATERPAPPLPGFGAAPARSRVGAIRPRLLSHALFYSLDVPRQIRFCSDMLGLRLSDRSGDGIAFIHGAHGSDHHLIAFAKSNGRGLHHFSWDVGSFDEVGLGAEQMRSAGYEHGWGVGRHVLGSNYFYYVRDPWGSYSEYSFDIDFVPHDLDWPAADHPPHDSFYVWGPKPPDDFITNYELQAA